MEEEESPVSTFLKKRSLPFFQGISDYINARSPGDQFIFLILGLLVVATSILGFMKLQEAIMIVQPAYGGSLTEGDVGAPRFINPLLALSTTDQDLTALTYAGLMSISGDGSLVPVLAQSYIVSPDGKTYQFTLKNNLKFSDGSPITADDVVFTVQKAQDPALKSPQYANWVGVQVVALDPHTVQFTLPAPYAQFLDDATLGILPAHLWRNVTNAEFPFSELETTPVGDGPFTVTSVTRDASGDITDYDLAANSSYALGRPYLDGFRFIFYEDQTSLQTALAKNQIDSAYGVLSKHVITAPYSHVFAVFFGQNSSNALTKVTTREALSLAIDRNNIVKQVLGGYATPLTGPVPPGSGIQLPSSANPPDLAMEQSLLEKSGWAFSTSTNSWKDSTGKSLSVTLTTTNVPELKVLAQTIQSDWQKLGVQTSIQVFEPGDLAQNVIAPRAYQALLFGMVVGKGDDLYDFWSSKERAAPGLNITGYSNPAVDTLLSKLRSESDPQARSTDLTQINQLISTDYPAAFIESPDFLYSVPSDLKGVILPQITAPSDRFATVATWYRRTEPVWPFLQRSAR
jgi:peptide/nickel transport system substrate-binding protein